MTPRWGRTLHAAVALTALFALWEILAQAFGSITVPAPSAVLRQMRNDGAEFYLRNLRVTLSAAAWGWLWGNLLAIATGVAIALVPRLRSVLLNLGVASYCLPLVAVGPIFMVTFGGAAPRIILAALAVYFPTLIGIDLGLRAASEQSRQLVRAFGGGAVQELTKVRWRAALPGFFGGLRIAAPSALLGALLGEFLGSESGLGVAMVSAQQSLAVERTWALAAIATITASAAYGLTGVAASMATPWARSLDATSTALAPSAELAGGRVTRLNSGRLGMLGTLLTTTILLVSIWQLFLIVFDVDPFLGYGPADVARYLFTDSGASDNRAILWEASVTTLRHAAIGLVSGTVAGCVVASVFILAPPTRAALLPAAMVLRAVPLVAMTPLIAIVFGRGLVGVAIATGIVTFFPVLTNMTTAMEDVPEQSLQLGTAYGATRRAVLWKIQFPYALPALFAAVRISAPLALTAALLVEWLFTGDGLGRLMLVAQNVFAIGQLWSAVVLVTLYSIILYVGIGAIENRVTRRLTSGSARAREHSRDQSASTELRYVAP